VNVVKNKQVILGITGIIASGKSTLSNYILKKYRLFDCDLCVKELYNEKIFLANIYNIFHTTNKLEILKIINNSCDLKLKLEKLIHTKVLEKIKEFLIKNKNEEIVFIDMPLLFEINYENNVDYTILVLTSKNKQLERLKLRNPDNYEELLRLNTNNKALKSKKAKADYIIYNNYSLNYLYKKFDEVLDKIINNLRG